MGNPIRRFDYSWSLGGDHLNDSAPLAGINKVRIVVLVGLGVGEEIAGPHRDKSLCELFLFTDQRAAVCRSGVNDILER